MGGTIFYAIFMLLFLRFIKNNALLIAIFCVVACIVSMLAAFATNLVINVGASLSGSTDETYRTFTVSAPDSTSDYSFEQVAAEAERITLYYKDGDNAVCSVYGAEEGDVAAVYGRSFSAEELSSSARAVILPAYYSLTAYGQGEGIHVYMIGDRVTLFGNGFTAIGMGATPCRAEVFTIPYRAAGDIAPSSLEIVLPQVPSANESEQFSEKCKNAFGGEVSLPDAPRSYSLGGDFALVCLLGAAVLAMCAMLLSYVYSHVADSRKKEWDIFRVYGATARRQILSCLHESVVLFAVFFAAGTGIYFLLAATVLTSGFFAPVLPAWGYVIIFFVLVAAYTAAFLPYAVRAAKRGVYENMTDG